MSLMFLSRNILHVLCNFLNYWFIKCICTFQSILQLHSLESAEYIKTFPLEVGTIVGFSGKKKHTEIFYQFVSFMTPGVIYHYDFNQPQAEPKVFREVTVPGLDSSLYESKQIFYESKDGTKVPMFIVCKKVRCYFVLSPLLFLFAFTNKFSSSTKPLARLSFKILKCSFSSSNDFVLLSVTLGCRVVLYFFLIPKFQTALQCPSSVVACLFVHQ